MNLAKLMCALELFVYEMVTLSSLLVWKHFLIFQHPKTFPNSL